MPGASNREKADKKDQLKERMKAEKDQRQAVKQEYIASVEQRMRGEKKDKDGKSGEVVTDGASSFLTFCIF